MSNLSDDDVASSRIHHADGSLASGPVNATAAVVHSVLSRFNPNAPSFSSAESAWITDMLALSAPPA